MPPRPAAEPLAAGGQAARAPRLGFACAWDRDAPGTWSGTPWRLRAALAGNAGEVDLVDVGISVSPLERALWKAAYARRRDGRLVSSWRHAPLWRARCGRSLRRRAARAGCDALLQVQDLALVGDVPYFVLQDLSYGALLRHTGDGPGGRAWHFPMLDRGDLERLHARQQRVHDHAAGVLAMSHWLARTLVADGLPAAKVHVVHPGILPPRQPVEPRPAPRRRLLFVGRDFLTKGGDLVVAAVELLRRAHDPALALTVVGPAAWPLPGPPPAGVRLLGRLPVDRVAALYGTHDLLVMPSRLEGFGIVFLEALARGMPCVGRRAFAMPELITPGEDGDLVDGDDPAELAEAIARVLGDDALYAACRRRAAAVRDRFTWERAAADTVRVIGRTLAWGGGRC
jgi:glycosyltransferase involved in cell wall biosynthesis